MFPCGNRINDGLYMFESLRNKLETAFKNIRGQGRLTEKNMKDGLKEIRLALLEADVNYKVVKNFIKRVEEEAQGQQVIESVPEYVIRCENRSDDSSAKVSERKCSRASFVAISRCFFSPGAPFFPKSS